MKIAIFTNKDQDIINFRIGLINELIKRGHQVFACTTKTSDDFVSKIEKTGAKFIDLKLKRGLKLFSSFLYILEVYQVSRKNKFNLCHNFSFKPVFLATIGQRLSGIKKIICTITGLGIVFSVNNKNLKIFILRKLALIGYKISGLLAEKIIFQNKEDKKLLIQKRIIPEKKSEIIVGSGVDSNYFSIDKIDNDRLEKLREELKIKEGEKIALMVSRILKEKGIYQFVEVAKNLREKSKNWKFILIGEIDKGNPMFISEKEIEIWQNNDYIIYLGGKDKNSVRDILGLTNVFVFPSYYREGAPKVVLEAMSMGLPIVGFENVGTSELVENGVNGFLVKEKNVKELSLATEKVLNDDFLAKKLGEEGRKMIINLFSDEIVVNKTIDVYNLD